MPERITLADGEYAHVRTFKHDFFAATGLYEGPSGLVILKLGRVARLFGLPMRWRGLGMMPRSNIFRTQQEVRKINIFVFFPR